MTEIEYRPFAKIARLNREVIVTEKIDGTNALVHVGDDGTVRAGARTRWIEPTPKGDNFGFAAWVAARVEELRALGPGFHYGEWYGAGIQRGYGLREKRFALFNVGRWNEEAHPPLCCGIVPVLARGMDIRAEVERALSDLRRFGSIAVPGFAKPEGVVVFHSASGGLYKVTLEKDEAPKGQK